MTVQLTEGGSLEDLKEELQAKLKQYNGRDPSDYVDPANIHEYGDSTWGKHGAEVPVATAMNQEDRDKPIKVRVNDGESILGEFEVAKKNQNKASTPVSFTELMTRSAPEVDNKELRDTVMQTIHEADNRPETSAAAPQRAETAAVEAVDEEAVSAVYVIPGMGEFQVPYRRKIVENNVLALVCKSGRSAFSPSTSSPIQICIDDNSGMYYLVAKFTDKGEDYTVFLEES